MCRHTTHDGLEVLRQKAGWPKAEAQPLARTSSRDGLGDRGPTAPNTSRAGLRARTRSAAFGGATMSTWRKNVPRRVERRTHSMVAAAVCRWRPATDGTRLRSAFPPNRAVCSVKAVAWGGITTGTDTARPWTERRRSSAGSILTGARQRDLLDAIAGQAPGDPMRASHRREHYSPPHERRNPTNCESPS